MDVVAYRPERFSYPKFIKAAIVAPYQKIIL
jgi:hypothetical protein